MTVFGVFGVEVIPSFLRVLSYSLLIYSGYRMVRWPSDSWLDLVSAGDSG